MAAVIAVSGVKNSGKTTLLVKLIPALNARGVKTVVLKHDGHSFAADREGTVARIQQLIDEGVYPNKLF